ncbi:MAG: glycosyltransferase family 2 protein [Deltaproteobacteria bacterium]|nr:glycosyltransferase family 2 protein [Deltaproteobacteria bacterium]
MTLKFELVIPAYNESKSLGSLFERCVNAARTHGFTSSQFQLVVVQNGSMDDSPATLEKLKSGPLGEWFRVVNIVTNQGYGNGIWTGLQSTSADYVGWTHADMQCDPTDAMKAYQMCTAATGQNLVVKGVRTKRNWKDWCVSRVFEFFIKFFLGFRVFEVNAQPKVFRRELLTSLKNPPKTFAFDLYVLYHSVKAKYQIQSFEVAFPPRIHGVSKWAATFFGRYKTILGMIRYMQVLARTEGRL